MQVAGPGRPDRASCRIGRQARIGAQAGVMADVAAGADVVGSPADAGAGVLPGGRGGRRLRAAGRAGGRGEGFGLRRWTAAAAGHGERRDRNRRGRRPGAEPDAQEPGRTIDIARIMHAIPHRYPFLMIDRVVEVVPQPLGDRHQERHGQRAFLPGPFPRPPGDAGRADHREHGADRRRAGGRDAGRRRRPAGWSISCRSKREIPPPGGAGRPACASTAPRSATAAMCGSSPPWRGWTAWRWRRRPTPP